MTKEHGLVFCINIESSIIRHDIDFIFQKYNLKSTKMMIFKTIARHNGTGISASEIIEEYHLKKSTISQHISELCKSGLIDKTIDPQCKSRTILHLSSSGEELSKNIINQFDEIDKMIFSSLT